MSAKELTSQERLADGHALLEQGDMPRAVESFQAVLDQEPENLQALAGLGFAYVTLGRYHDVVPILERGVANSPHNAGLLEMLGVSYAYTGNIDAAEQTLRKALRFGNRGAQTVVNLAAVLNEQGKFDEAQSMFSSCLRREPEHLQARYNLGLLKLLKGEFKEGWKGFELRNEVVNRGAPQWAQRCPASEWHGEDLKDCRILLYAEQGLGDSIQFARYASLVAGLGASVTLQCAPVLTDLLGAIDGVSRCVSTESTVDDADFKVSLLSLPHLFETTADSIPEMTPYITIPDATIKSWGGIIARMGEGPKVGLVWSGNPDNKTDYKRSVRLSEMEAILRRRDICFISLQIGETASQIASLDPKIHPHTLFEDVRPLTDVAAVIQNLDLLITVDTALAHLAGALATPVWTMITHFPDWRWMLYRADTPWYRSMRLFRQPAVGDWQSVVHDINNALDQLSDEQQN